MSPKLFNAVLQKVLGPIQTKWKAKGFGFQVKAGSRLTNLRFADDILLVAAGAAEMESMLNDLAGGAGLVGLQLRFGKTQVLCNNLARGQAAKEKLQGRRSPCYNRERQQRISDELFGWIARTMPK